MAVGYLRNVLFWGRFFLLICDFEHIGKPSVRTLTDPFSPPLSQYGLMEKHTFFLLKKKMGATFAFTFAAVWFTKMMDLDVEASIFAPEVGINDVTPHYSLIRHSHATKSPMHVSY